MINNLRSENLMTQRLSAEKQVSKQNKNPLSIALHSLHHKGRPVSVHQYSIIEKKNPVPTAKLI